MSLTTVSSASFFGNIPRVFGLGRAASPPPSPPLTRTRPSARHASSSPRKRPSSPPARTPPPTRARSPARTRRSTTARTRRSSPNRARPSSPPPPLPRLAPTRSHPPPPARSRSRVPQSQSRRPPPPRARSASTISTLSSLISTRPPPDVPPAPSWRASLRALAKPTKSGADRVEVWRLGVAAAGGGTAGTVPIEEGAAEVANAGGASAVTAAAAPEVVPTGTTDSGSTRVTDSQDLRSLSDEDIFALTQNIKNEEASRRPLVSPITQLSELRAEFSPFADVVGHVGDTGTGAGVSEYAGPNANVLRKIDWLQRHGGWLGIRRTRGDGDCFYRSLAFAYVEKIMSAAEPGLAVATSLSHLESTLPLLEQAGFQRIVFEDFYECFAELIQQIVPPTGKPPLTNETLLEQFQNPEISNSIVVFLRLLTSSYIRLSPEDDFTPFLFHPDTGDMIDVRTFVEMFVEATGREADHPQIMALSKALRVRIEVAYLDNSGGTPLADGTVRVDFVKFAPEGAEEDGTKPVVLLYRPGHYDTLEEKVEG